MTTYYALTTENAAALGWRIVAIGDDRAEAEAAACAAIGTSTDLHTQTDRRNLVVVSRTEARRRYGVGEYEVERYYGEEIDVLADRRRQEALIAAQERAAGAEVATEHAAMDAELRANGGVYRGEEWAR